MSGSDLETDQDPAEQPGQAAPQLYTDAATRVSNPSKFDEWYYGIEDKLGQGTVGMVVCLVLFITILLLAILFKPI
jgi:hypothetical protein